jgi:hypothetical protein
MEVVINAHRPLSRDAKYSLAPSVTTRLPGAMRPVCVNSVTFTIRGSGIGAKRHTVADASATPAKKIPTPATVEYTRLAEARVTGATGTGSDGIG